jgi:hypothetical protein
MYHIMAQPINLRTVKKSTDLYSLRTTGKKLTILLIFQKAKVISGNRPYAACLG